MHSYSVVLPVHNQARGIAAHVKRLCAYLSKYAPQSEVVLVENGSQDLSAEVVRGLEGVHDNVPVRALSLSQGGLGLAYQHGTDDVLRRWSHKPDRFLLLSAGDLPFGTSDLESHGELLRRAPETPFAIGSKAHGESKIARTHLRTALSALFYGLRWLLLGMRTRDCQGTLFISLSAAAEIRPSLQASNYFCSTEAVFAAERLGLGPKEMPVSLEEDLSPTPLTTVLVSAVTMLRQVLALKLRAYPALPLPRVRIADQSQHNTAPRMLRRVGEHWVLPLLLGFAAFGLTASYSILDPTYVDWMLDGDRANHFLGLNFFRWENWHFPLGAITHYPEGGHNSVLQTDSIPLLAVLTRVFTHVLPHPFQYFGCYLLSCLFLQALLAAALLRLLMLPRLAIVLGTVWMSTAPILMYHFGHIALCAHWAYLFLLWISLAAYLRGWSYAALPVGKLTLVQMYLATVHPYLVMGTSVWIGTMYSQTARQLCGRPLRAFLKRVAVSALLIGTTAICFGYLSVQNPTTPLGSYSGADLTALINPAGFVHSFALRWRGSTTEGFAYLGFGGFFLFALLIRLYRTNPTKVRQASHVFASPFLLGALLLAFYSLSPHVTVLANPILNLRWLYLPFGPLPEIFRATGRFICPLYYLIFLSLIVIPSRLLPARKALAALTIAVVLHLVEFYPRFVSKPWAKGVQWAMAKESPWHRKLDGAQHVIVLPPLIPSEFFDCGKSQLISALDFYRIAYQASERGMSLNSALTSRLSQDSAQFLCRDSLEKWDHGPYDKFTAYFVSLSFAQSHPPPFPLLCQTFTSFSLCRLKPSLF